MKSLIKKVLPKILIEAYRKLVLIYTKSEFKNLSTAEVMSKIYKENWWGKNNQDEQTFFSGRGSHDDEIITPYIKNVSKFLNNKNYTIVDIGCGDFNIGKNLVSYSKHYIGCDIVPELIDFNRSKFKLENLEFRTLNLVTDPLPSGDVLILRQVLQHLSNANIEKIIPKLYSYKYLILTEPVPRKPFKSNIDNPDGPDIRLSVKSGLILDEPPFDMKFISKTELVKVEDEKDDAFITTLLYSFQ